MPQDSQEVEIYTEYRGVTVQMTYAQWQLISEAGERCDLSPADFLLEASLAQARRIVPADCQPSGELAPMPGLFADGESNGS